MQVVPIKTHTITPQENLEEILDRYFGDNSGQYKLSENTVIAITSKIVALLEGRVVSVEDVNKDSLVREESQWYIPRSESKYNASITITHDTLMAASGIDESNANGKYILLPKNPQESANRIREYLITKHKVKNLGVILTDSRTLPLRWGSIGICVSFSGFIPVNNYIGKKDLFGRELHLTKVDVIDSLAASAVYVMGETIEQTPLALITNIPHIEFVNRPPTEEEYKMFHIQKEDDLYAPILIKANWQKGKGK